MFDSRIETMDRLIGHIRTSLTVHTFFGSPKAAFYSVAITCLAVLLVIRAVQIFKQPRQTRPATPDLEKPRSRSFKTPPRKPGGSTFSLLKANELLTID